MVQTDGARCLQGGHTPLGNLIITCLEPPFHLSGIRPEFSVPNIYIDAAPVRVPNPNRVLAVLFQCIVRTLIQTSQHQAPPSSAYFRCLSFWDGSSSNTDMPKYVS
ncbi:hypothetical protein SCLCIDRAFT_506359 [Scleroderma citrinum Foug A]|uniref:Uncharacterized protein n=1 Tax=Scleroderma citrinum Foug A TaxID=1036808 RepID=A0A0C3EPQ7_9AGAM|nr:hypothetical protein SCLCIDRAFT_506359 [Scleroderma citrinum Foug A]